LTCDGCNKTIIIYGTSKRIDSARIPNDWFHLIIPMYGWSYTTEDYCSDCKDKAESIIKEHNLDIGDRE